MGITILMLVLWKANMDNMKDHRIEMDGNVV